MATKPLPDQEYLRQCFEYDPETGELRWKRSRPLDHFKSLAASRSWNTRYGGTIAESLDKNGYRFVDIEDARYAVHRVAWKMAKGEDPIEIDHINRKKDDNKLSNLRLASNMKNQHNKTVHKNNISGLKGVSRIHDKFFARIRVNKTDIYLGVFSTAQEAHVAYCRAAKRYFGEFATDGRPAKRAIAQAP